MGIEGGLLKVVDRWCNLTFFYQRSNTQQLNHGGGEE